MSRPPPPPAPTHLLRSHSAPISAIHVSDDNGIIYSGDASGKVVVTSTHNLRAIAIWSPHTDGVLGLEEFGVNIITHGRDHKLHIWNRVDELPPSTRLGGSAALPGLPTPVLVYSMDVNALNYCRFSLLPGVAASEIADEAIDGRSTALIALPNLVDSSTADVWSLPKRDRLHAAIGQETNQPVFSIKPDSGRGSQGIIMSLHLFISDQSSTSGIAARPLRLLCAYESGSVMLRQYTRSERPKSVEGQGWEVLWTAKSHVETIMAMAVSKAKTFALTVSADHIISKYGISDSHTAQTTVHRTKYPGNSSIAIRDDGKVCAVGGWDGCIRLYSTKSFKPLGTLRYHKVNCQCVAFAHDISREAEDDEDPGSDEDDEDDGDELDADEKATRSKWLLAGSKDNRLSIWTLMSFKGTAES